MSSWLLTGPGPASLLGPWALLSPAPHHPRPPHVILPSFPSQIPTPVLSLDISVSLERLGRRTPLNARLLY